MNISADLRRINDLRKLNDTEEESKHNKNKGEDMPDEKWNTYNKEDSRRVVSTIETPEVSVAFASIGGEEFNICGQKLSTSHSSHEGGIIIETFVSDHRSILSEKIAKKEVERKITNILLEVLPQESKLSDLGKVRKSILELIENQWIFSKE